MIIDIEDRQLILGAGMLFIFAIFVVLFVAFTLGIAVRLFGAVSGLG